MTLGHDSEPPAHTARLTVQHLAKRYGNLPALRDVSFTVRDREVLGLLGPNGSGKTTLMACLAGLLSADAGDIGYHGHAPSAATRQSTVFYLPDGIAPWRDQPAEWVLAFAADVFGVHAYDRDDILRTLRIAELGSQRVGTLSKGQRKRLLLALALQMPQPVLLLDEPFDGLDLRLTYEVLQLLQRVAHAGRSLLVSLHNLHDAARLCDRLVLLDDGRTVAEGTLAELRERSGRHDAPLEEVFLAFV